MFGPDGELGRRASELVFGRGGARRRPIRCTPRTCAPANGRRRCRSRPGSRPRAARGSSRLGAGQRAAGREQRLPEHRVRAHDVVDRACAPRGPRRRGRIGETTDERRDPRLLGLREPDPEVETERRGDLVVEVGADGLAGDAADHLADEPAVGGRVVAVLRAGLVVRDLLRPARRRPGPTRALRRATSHRRPTRAPPGATAGTSPGCRPCRRRRTRASSRRPARRRRACPPARACWRRSRSRPWSWRRRARACARPRAGPVATSAIPPHRSTTFSPR